MTKKNKYQREKLFKKDLKDFEHLVESTDPWLQKKVQEGCFLGCVTEVHRSGLYVSPFLDHEELDFEKTWFCQLRGSFFQTHPTTHSPLVVGDRVLVQDLPNESQRSGSILAVLKRKSCLFRESTLRAERLQLLFSNLDYLWGVFSVEQPKFRTIDVDRFLVWGEQSSVDVGLIFTKKDLLIDKEAFVKIKKFYESIRPSVFLLSKENLVDKNWMSFRKTLNHRISAFYGESGVGKSSLINELKPDLKQAIDEQGENLSKKRYRYGRHTTTYSVLIPTPYGGVVDSPGWRSFRLPFVSQADLRAHYKEFSLYSCQFRDCSHEKEEGCGVKKALKEGLIEPWRYENYLALKRYAHD
jgi:ribosome biogenesis GTPase